MPEGFTIHGYAGPRLRGDQLLAGFADGYFVSLSAASGEVALGALAGRASDQFVDVDIDADAARRPRLRRLVLGRPLRASTSRDGAITWRLRDRRGRRRQRRRRIASTSCAPRRACTPPTPTGTSSGARG